MMEHDYDKFSQLSSAVPRAKIAVSQTEAMRGKSQLVENVGPGSRRHTEPGPVH